MRHTHIHPAWIISPANRFATRLPVSLATPPVTSDIRICNSHNLDINWLPQQLQNLGLSDLHAESMGPALGIVHWTWIGWLLRLADIFDCDASRTPKILFEHSGIADKRS